jgi:hypothetical protein
MVKELELAILVEEDKIAHSTRQARTGHDRTASMLPWRIALKRLRTCLFSQRQRKKESNPRFPRQGIGSIFLCQV